MLYLHINPADPASRLFLFHHETSTLGELFLGTGPGGSHHIRGHQSGPIPTDALDSFVEYLETTHPTSSNRLTTLSGGAAPDLPESIILMAAGKVPPAILIHYPALGFTAGIRKDGTKIPPTWTRPESLTPEQRSHLIHQAAETLMQALADRRQVT